MPSIILRLVTATTIATALVVGAPALAASTSPAKTVLKYDAKSGKYCVTDPAITGSHLQRITCKTATQWSSDGLDLPKTTMLAQK